MNFSKMPNTANENQNHIARSRRPISHRDRERLQEHHKGRKLSNEARRRLKEAKNRVKH